MFNLKFGFSILDFCNLGAGVGSEMCTMCLNAFFSSLKSVDKELIQLCVSSSPLKTTQIECLSPQRLHLYSSQILMVIKLVFPISLMFYQL